MKSSSIEYSNGMPTRYFTQDGIQDYRLTWDYQKGNLSSRQDARGNVNKTESFGYDNLDRLTSANVSGGVSFSASYSSNGNIQSKTDAVTYSYHGTKFNAVTGATNGSSVVPSIEQNITYTAFQQPAKVTEGQYELNYTYGSDYNRIKSELKQNGNTIRTRYYFSSFEKDNSGRYVQYVSSPVGLIAIVENNVTHYTYTDHLGSILTVTNGGGVIEVEQSFDAWGRRRDVNSWALLAPTAATGLPDWLYRGYTGHEHLDQFGLINMNGRMYDPVLGRMLSPDNYVQEPGMTQSFNRYTYALNNPLKYTDPSGELFFIVPQIGFGKGGFRLGVEVGFGFKNIASISASAGFNFTSGQGYWSVQGSLFNVLYGGYGSSGWFAGAGYGFKSGLGISAGYSQAGGWNVGMRYGGNLDNFGGGAGLGWSEKGGFDWNVSGGYTEFFNVSPQEIIVQGGGSAGMAEGYNSSPAAGYNDAYLQDRLKSEFGVSVGTFDLALITTRVGEGYELNTEGAYINTTTGKTVGAYYQYRAFRRSELRVSQKYASETNVEFRAIVGHELIHAYHGYKFGGNHDQRYSDRVAYKYTYDTYMRAGQFLNAFQFYNTATTNGFWGTYPSNYRIPSIWGW